MRDRSKAGVLRRDIAGYREAIAACETALLQGPHNAIEAARRMWQGKLDVAEAALAALEAQSQPVDIQHVTDADGVRRLSTAVRCL